jgi:soluble lytic murein transglycosylase-like protein
MICNALSRICVYHGGSVAGDPKDARGLMRLMPGTARRFGVLLPFDPADNIDGGLQ